MTEPAYLDRELGLACAERMNRLLGLRLKYLIGIPVGAAAGFLAQLAGTNQMVTVAAFLAAQMLYGYWLGWFEVRRRCRAERRKLEEIRRQYRAELAREFDEYLRRSHAS